MSNNNNNTRLNKIITEDLNILYSPSFWCKRFDTEDGTLKYFKYRIKSGSQRVRKVIQCHLNIPYGKDIYQTLDVFGIDLKDDSPIFVHVSHGCYGLEFGKENSCYMAEMFYTQGIKTIVIGFNLLSALEEQINDVTSGVKKALQLAEKWGSRKVVIVGHSSSAHLVGNLLQKMPEFSIKQKQLLQGLVMINGIYDIVPIRETNMNTVLKLNEENAVELSPYHQKLEPSNVKKFIVLSEYNTPAFVDQSTNYFKKLKKNRDNVEFIVEKGQDHYTVVENLTKSSHDLSQFFIKLLK